MSALTDLMADLADTGPDTPVDPRQPGYALALLVEHASAEGNEGYFLGLGERVFSALALDVEEMARAFVAPSSWDELSEPVKNEYRIRMRHVRASILGES